MSSHRAASPLTKDSDIGAPMITAIVLIKAEPPRIDRTDAERQKALVGTWQVGLAIHARQGERIGRAGHLHSSPAVGTHA